MKKEITAENRYFPLFITVGLILLMKLSRLYGSQLWKVPPIAVLSIVQDLALAVILYYGFFIISSNWSKKSYRIGWWILIATCFTWLSIDFVNTAYFYKTGSTLDGSTLKLFFSSFREILPIIRSELTITTVILTVFLVAVFWLTAIYSYSSSTKNDQKSRLNTLIKTSSSPSAFLMCLVAPLIVFFSTNKLVLLPSATRCSATTILKSLVSGDGYQSNTQNKERLKYDSRQLDTIQRDSDLAGKNVVLIVLESTRAISTNPFGATKKLTPFLEEVATENYYFTNAYAIVPHTSKALVSIHCGITPKNQLQLTPQAESMVDGLPANCLPTLLNKKGYETVFFQSAKRAFERRPQLVKNLGFREFYSLESYSNRSDFKKTNYFAVEDAVMLSPIEEWIKNHLSKTSTESKPFAMTILTGSTHHQYLAPKGRYKRINQEPTSDIQRYENAIFQQDQFLRETLETIYSLSPRKKTLVVIVGDHGEGFKEHGRSQHDNTIYQEGIRVPLVFIDTDINSSSHRRNLVVSQLDILPTIINRLGLQASNGSLRGIDILSSTTNTNIQQQENRPVFSFCWYPNYCSSMIHGDYKYIYHYSRRPNEFYNISEDPLEQKNLIDDPAQLSLVASFEKKLTNFSNDTNGIFYAPADNSELNSGILNSVPTPRHYIGAKFYDGKIELVGYDTGDVVVDAEGRVSRDLHAYFCVKKTIDTEPIYLAEQKRIGRKTRTYSLDHAVANGQVRWSEIGRGKCVKDTFAVHSGAANNRIKVRIGFMHSTRLNQKKAMPKKANPITIGTIDFRTSNL